jgi:hypothetical protein
MRFGEKLYQYLSQNADIEALVGNRIFPIIANDEAQTPYIVYSLVSDVPSYTLSGNTQTSSKRVQISIYCENYAVLENIAKVVSDVLDTWNSFDSEIQSVSKLNEIDKYEFEMKLYGRILDFSVFY